MASRPIAGGFVPFTTIDYPGLMSAVVFLHGCPYRCKYCSNPVLLETIPESETTIRNWEYIIDFLKKRAGRLDAVVFSGGEATLQADALLSAIAEIKNIFNYKIGLHTNGALPDNLKKLLPHINWVGLDIKTDEKNYGALTGVPNAWKNVMESLDALISWGGEFEVRTTLDSRFITRESLLSLAKFLSARGVKNYAVQKCRPVGLAEDTHFAFNELFDEADMKKLFTNFEVRS